MCRVKARVSKGVIPSERVALIETYDGERAEVMVSDAQAQRDSVTALEVERAGDRVLVELPRETALGQWRIWVKSDLVDTARR